MESIKSNSSKCEATCEAIVKRALGAHHDSHALFIYVYINNYRQHPSAFVCVCCVCASERARALLILSAGVIPDVSCRRRVGIGRSAR